MQLLTITPQLLAMGIPQVENIIDTLPNHPVKRYSQRSMEQVDTWILHHTASEAPLISQARYHVNNRGWARIGYSIMIVDGSRIVQTNYLDVESVHCAGWNHRSMGVCVLGDLSKRQLTPRERELLLAVFVSLNAMYPDRQIKGHNEATGKTSCPVISAQRVREDLLATEEKLNYLESEASKVTVGFAFVKRIESLEITFTNPKYGEYAKSLVMRLEPILAELGYVGEVTPEGIVKRVVSIYKNSHDMRFEGEGFRKLTLASKFAQENGIMPSN